MAYSYRTLLQIDWKDSELVTRLWGGSGPVLDTDLNVWKGTGIVQGLDVIEAVMNGEATTLNIILSGVSGADATPLYILYTAGQMKDSDLRIMIQTCNELNKPVGDPEIIFRGEIDNAIFKHVVTSENTQEATIAVEVTNRFAMRRLTHGGVYSSADQVPYAKVLNPSGAPDRIAERTHTMEDIALTWPVFKGGG